MTDGQPAVVANLRYNAEATAALGALAVPAEVRELEWGDPRLEELPSAVDAVVGGDITYDSGSFTALAACLRGLLRPRGTAAAAVLGVTRRSEATHECLLDALAAEELGWEEMAFPTSAWDEEADAKAESWMQVAHDARGRAEEGGPTVIVLRIEATDAAAA